MLVCLLCIVSSFSDPPAKPGEPLTSLPDGTNLSELISFLYLVHPDWPRSEVLLCFYLKVVSLFYLPPLSFFVLLSDVGV